MALTSIRTGTPDSTGGEKVASLTLQEDSSIEPVGGFPISSKIDDGPSAHRSSVTAADTAADMSTGGFGTSLKAVNNAPTLCIFCSFLGTGGSATVRPVYYDGATSNTVLFLGESLSFVADTSYRLTSTGAYMSQAQLVDAKGAGQVKVYVASLGDTAGTDVYCELLY